MLTIPTKSTTNCCFVPDFRTVYYHAHVKNVYVFHLCSKICFKILTILELHTFKYGIL